jgi:hypothetical protein
VHVNDDDDDDDDVAGMNGLVTFFLNKNSKMLRRIFLKELNLELVKEQLTIRATTSCLSRKFQEKYLSSLVNLS